MEVLIVVVLLMVAVVALNKRPAAVRARSQNACPRCGRETLETVRPFWSKAYRRCKRRWLCGWNERSAPNEASSASAVTDPEACPACGGKTVKITPLLFGSSYRICKRTIRCGWNERKLSRNARQQQHSSKPSRFPITCHTCGGRRKVSRTETCPSCFGSRYFGESPCLTCGASGLKSVERDCETCGGSGKI